MLITETIDDVTLSITEGGELEIDGMKIDATTANALRLFLWRTDVDDRMNHFERTAGTLASAA